MGLAYDVVPIRISMPGSTPGGMFGETIRSPSPLVSKKRHRAFSKIYPSTAYSPAPTTRRSLRFRRMIQRTGVQRPQQMSQHAQGRVRSQQEKTWLSCRSTKSRDRSGRDGGALPSSQVRRGEIISSRPHEPPTYILRSTIQKCLHLQEKVCAQNCLPG